MAGTPTAYGGATVRQGLAALGEEATRVMSLLDGVFLQWGRDAGATERTLPALLPVEDVAALGVYENFPHLAMVATTVQADQVAGNPERHKHLSPTLLKDAELALPSATCYGVYADLTGSRVPDGTLVTAVNTCYRNETHFDGLRRLRAFRMREVVALGGPEHVQGHIAHFTELITDFAGRLGLSLEQEAAVDPFFDPDGVQAVWQKIAPVKHEFVHGGNLAIASVNNHRTFFGDSCGISLEHGSKISTGCAAFGLERWIVALTDTYDGDWNAILRAIEKARPDAVPGT
jgi:hypothetical protein